MHTQYVNRLIELLQQAIDQNTKPYASIIVFNNTIIAEAINETHLQNDPTAHAELLAIRKASQVISPDQLKQAILYASGEPCLMCQTAAAYAQLKEVYYICSKEEMLTIFPSPIETKKINMIKLSATSILDRFTLK